MKQDIAERFWVKVKSLGPDECWPWTSATDGRYGHFWINEGRRSAYAHRVCYELTRGPIPPGLVIRHSCDNTICVNPAHLGVGTAKDNVQDQIIRGRRPDQRGERNPVAKLTAEKVREIRRLYSAGDTSQHKLGAQFGVCREVIRSVVRRRTWQHVE